METQLISVRMYGSINSINGVLYTVQEYAGLDCVHFCMLYIHFGVCMDIYNILPDIPFSCAVFEVCLSRILFDLRCLPRVAGDVRG